MSGDLLSETLRKILISEMSRQGLTDAELGKRTHISSDFISRLRGGYARSEVNMVKWDDLFKALSLSISTEAISRGAPARIPTDTTTGPGDLEYRVGQIESAPCHEHKPTLEHRLNQLEKELVSLENRFTDHQRNVGRHQ